MDDDRQRLRDEEDAKAEAARLGFDRVPYPINKLIVHGDNILVWVGSRSERVHVLTVMVKAYDCGEDKPPGVQLSVWSPQLDKPGEWPKTLVDIVYRTAELFDGGVIPAGQLTVARLWDRIVLAWRRRDEEGIYPIRAGMLASDPAEKTQEPATEPTPQIIRVELSLDPDIVPFLREMAGLLAGAPRRGGEEG